MTKISHTRIFLLLGYFDNGNIPGFPLDTR